MKREWTEEQRAEASRKAKERAAAQKIAERQAQDAALSGDAAEPAPALGDPVAEAAEDARNAERRRRLLGDIDPEAAALITDDELAEIEREENERAKAEAKKQALADIRAKARQQARVEHDLISASVLRSDAERARLAEPVTFRITLPGDGAGHHGRNGFRVDGQLYQAGQTYTRPRAVYESLVANHYRAWLNEVQFRTLDQQKPGNSAQEVLAQTIPQFEVRHAA